MKEEEKEIKALEEEAELDNLEAESKAEEDIDVLLQVKGRLTYPQLSKWLDTEIAAVTLKGSKKDSDLTMVIHAKDGGKEQTLKSFDGSNDTIRMPLIMKSYVLYREWYSRLDTEPCVDLLVYNDKKEEFALIVADLDHEMLIFPGFTWAAPIALVKDWLNKRGESTYVTTFEFSDVAAWLDHELTNRGLQPGLILNYKDGPSICISGSGASKQEGNQLEIEAPEKGNERGKRKGEGE